jgi:hypothetical protein
MLKNKTFASSKLLISALTSSCVCASSKGGEYTSFPWPPSLPSFPLLLLPKRERALLDIAPGCAVRAEGSADLLADMELRWCDCVCIECVRVCVNVRWCVSCVCVCVIMCVYVCLCVGVRVLRMNQTCTSTHINQPAAWATSRVLSFT